MFGAMRLQRLAGPHTGVQHVIPFGRVVESAKNHATDDFLGALEGVVDSKSRYSWTASDVRLMDVNAVFNIPHFKFLTALRIYNM